MTRSWLLALLGLTLLFCVGMGGLGGTTRVNVPEPTTNYLATIIDQSDAAVQVEKISFDGYTAISGELGNGQLSIDFERITTIDFVSQESKLIARVSLKDGKTISLVVGKGAYWYAQLPYGDFKIAVEDVKKIELQKAVNR